MFTLHDYSERGLVNALFDFVISAEHPDALWADLIKRSLLWYSALMEPTPCLVYIFDRLISLKPRQQLLICLSV